MNALFIASLAILAVATAAPSGPLGGAVLSGPSGIVTDHGPIGPASLGLGLGVGHGAAVVAAPVVGHGLALGHGVGAVTNGGGTIGASAHGAAIRGPPTAPVVVAGPAGKVVADGLWGPTANVGLTGHGAWGNGAWGNGAWGHGGWGLAAGHGAWGHGW